MAGDEYRELGPRRAAGANSRARGTNPRARGTNPRRMGTNRSAGTRADVLRVARLVRRAVARHRVRFGPWCSICDDELVVAVLDDQGVERFDPCPDHRPMLSNVADDILAGRYTPEH